MCAYYRRRICLKYRGQNRWAMPSFYANPRFTRLRETLPVPGHARRLAFATHPFRGRHFRDEVIVLCVRWYLRYPLSYRNLEEIMAERGLAVDHSTIAGWVLTYATVLNERIRSEMRHPGRSWRSTKQMCGSPHSGPIYIERSTRPAAKEECLSKLILFGEPSLWRALSECGSSCGANTSR